MIAQRISVEEDEVLQKAMTYYRTLFAVNGIRLSERYVEFVAWVAIRGGCATSAGTKKLFMEKHKYKNSSFYSMLNKLIKKGIFYKKNHKSYLLDDIKIDFKEHDIVLNILIKSKKESGANKN